MLIEGEAGIGKTRLAEELLEGLTARASPRRGRAHMRLRAAWPMRPSSSGLTSGLCVQGWPPLPAVWRTEVARLRPELLTEFPTCPAPEPLTERWQRQRLSLKRWPVFAD
ncbi:MAG: hypothetical protein R2911_19000 [Caldilineaceae bacterium]